MKNWSRLRKFNVIVLGISLIGMMTSYMILTS